MSVARYTRFVSFGKHFLWLMLAFLVVMVGWIATYNSEEGSKRIVFTSASQVPENLQNIMENPRYQGLDAHNQPYNILADRATQIDENHLTLDVVRAEITEHDGTWIAINAKNGAIDIQNKQLQLTGGVEAFSDTGYTLRTDHAQVDINKGNAYGDSHIEGQGPVGTIQAESFEAEDRGQVVRFKGNVKVRIYHEK
jgi:lipopolysaccharide export system protein LptC